MEIFNAKCGIFYPKCGIFYPKCGIFFLTVGKILQFRYNELSLVFRIYVYLRQLRRGGCTHIVGGLSALPEGALAVECPACPQPGRNIEPPEGGLITRPP
jgi:hypothetical protein